MIIRTTNNIFVDSAVHLKSNNSGWPNLLLFLRHTKSRVPAITIHSTSREQACAFDKYRISNYLCIWFQRLPNWGLLLVRREPYSNRQCWLACSEENLYSICSPYSLFAVLVEIPSFGKVGFVRRTRWDRGFGGGAPEKILAIRSTVPKHSVFPILDNTRRAGWPL